MARMMGAGRSQPLRDKRVRVGIVILEDDRPERGRHALRVHLVLQHDRDAVERPIRLRARLGGFEAIRIGERLLVDGDDGRAAPVEPLDAVEVELDELPRRQLARGKRRVHGSIVVSWTANDIVSSFP